MWATPLLLAPPAVQPGRLQLPGAGRDGRRAHRRLHVRPRSISAARSPTRSPPVWQHTAAPYGPVFLAVASAAVRADPRRPPRRALRHAASSPCSASALMAAVAAPARPAQRSRSVGRAVARRAQPARAAPPGRGRPQRRHHAGPAGRRPGRGAAAGWPVLGAVLVTLAALVKAPAALGLAAVVAAPGAAPAAARAQAVATTPGRGRGHHRRRDGGRRHRATAGSAPSTPPSPRRTGPSPASSAAPPARSWRGSGSDLARPGAAGLALPWARASAVAAVLAIWLRRARLRPVYALGLSLTAVAVLGPAIRPWYALWGLFLIAAAAPSASVRHRVAAVTRRPRARRPAERRSRRTRCSSSWRCAAACSPLVVLWQAHQAPELAPPRSRPRTGMRRPAHRPRAACCSCSPWPPPPPCSLATVPLLRDWFDLRRLLRGRRTAGSTTAAGLYDYRVPGDDVRLHLSAVRRARHAADGAARTAAAIAVALLLNLAAASAVRAAHRLAGPGCGATAGTAGRLRRVCCCSPCSNRSATPSASAR